MIGFDDCTYTMTRETDRAVAGFARSRAKSRDREHFRGGGPAWPRTIYSPGAGRVEEPFF